MDIRNPNVFQDIETGVPLRLNLGAGLRRRDGFYSVDYKPLPGIDIVADLNEPLDLLPTNSVSEIYTRHALEHVDNLLDLMCEAHRLLCHEGRFEIIVPHFSNPFGYSDPTHVRFFGVYSMNYFMHPEDQPRRRVHAFYCEARFKAEVRRIRFYRDGVVDRAFGGVMEYIVNLTPRVQEVYERRLCSWLHAWEVRFVLRAVKV